jgi:hypothetical protein
VIAQIFVPTLEHGNYLIDLALLEDAANDLLICGRHNGTEEKVLHLALFLLTLKQFLNIVDGLHGLVDQRSRRHQQDQSELSYVVEKFGV